MNRWIYIFILLTAFCAPAFGQSRMPSSAPVATKEEKPVPPPYAWTLTGPLATITEAPMDTTEINYSLKYVPAIVTPAYATTGNYGCAGQTMIFMDRPAASDFFFRDALRHWLPSRDNTRFYNSRLPMTILGYSFGGGKEGGQDRLNLDFSGNVNKRLQIGMMLDYPYSKGAYNNQAMKDLIWGFSGSYIGERYEFQGFWRHYNSLNKENGGIVNDLYITDPAEVQGGVTSVDYKTIPTRLSASHNRVKGGELLLSNKYKLGFHREVEQEDTIIEEFVPVTAFTWNIEYRQSSHRFTNTNATQDTAFWDNTYFNIGKTVDFTSYWQLRNVVGISLLEGFNKYAKAGLSVFLTHEYRHFGVRGDTIDVKAANLLTPLPDIPLAIGNKGQNMMWVGAQIARRQGRILNYEATGEIGFVGEAAGEVKLDGNVSTHIPLFGDTVSIVGYGRFTNTAVPYLLKHYVSNHFIWDNDFGMTRSLRIGGNLSIPRTGTHLHVGVENVQNLVYFNELAMPAQCGSSVQVFSATLRQNFHYRAWHWDNSITYQTSSNDAVIPMPKLAIYSNMYVRFRIARVFDVQLGVDCDYYTKYKAVNYQPATMAFYNQREVECGNYPFMNLYVNMKLSRAHFFVMYSHVNQGWFGNEFFSMPHYPLNPRRMQMGISVNFAN